MAKKKTKSRDKKSSSKKKSASSKKSTSKKTKNKSEVNLPEKNIKTKSEIQKTKPKNKKLSENEINLKNAFKDLLSNTSAQITKPNEKNQRSEEDKQPTTFFSQVTSKIEEKKKKLEEEILRTELIDYLKSNLDLSFEDVIALFQERKVRKFATQIKLSDIITYISREPKKTNSITKQEKEEYKEKVFLFLTKHTGEYFSNNDLLDNIGGDAANLRICLRQLYSDGFINKTGVARATRYFVPDKNKSPSVVRRKRST